MGRARAAIPELFRAVAARQPRHVAVKWRGATLSYRELDHRSDALAQAIHDAEIKGRANIGMMIPRSTEAIVAMLGILKAGCAYVPIDESYPAAVITDYLTRCEAAAIVIRPGAVLPPAVNALPSLYLDECGEVRAAFLATTPPNPEDSAYVIFTSGTTGPPKGVVVAHRGVSRLVLDTNYITIGEQDKLLLLSPLTFDASTFEIWGALLNGATLVVYPEPIFDPSVLKRTVRDERVSILFLTTALFHLIVQRSIDSLEGLSVLLVGGEVTRPDAVRRLFDRYPSITFIAVYGPTENTTFTTFHTMTAACVIGDTVPIGRPISGTSVCVLDADRRQVARGEIGELYTGGLGLALGYLNSPDTTRAAFVTDPMDPSSKLYRTGDLVRELEDGAIDFVGRTDGLVKVRGYRVSIPEIEKRIGDIDGVENVIVLAEDDGSGSRWLVAYVQSQGEPPRVKQMIVSSLKRTVPQYMIPNIIHVRPTLPINWNGKIDKAALRSERRAECSTNTK